MQILFNISNVYLLCMYTLSMQLNRIHSESSPQQVGSGMATAKLTSSEATTNLELRGGQWETRGYLAAEMGLRTVPPETLVYFGVDDYVNEETQFDTHLCILPPTDKHKLQQQQQAFDYSYDLAKVSHSPEGHSEIIKFISSNISSSQQPEPEDDTNHLINSLNDNYIHKLLQDRFGSLALESKEYKELFRNYKEEVLEEYSFRMKEAKGLRKKNKDLGWEEIMEEMKPVRRLKFVTGNDIRNNQSPNVFKSQLDPYKVPRENPEEFVLKNAIAEKRGKSPLGNPDYALLKQNSSNLNYLDPCVNDLAFFKFTGNLQFPLVKSILGVVGSYPLGVTPNFLLEEFKRRHGYFIDYLSLGFMSFEDLLKRNENVFTVQTGKTMILVFSAFQDSICGVDGILRKLHHYLAVMVNGLGGRVEVDQVEGNMRDMFDISLNLRAWGFQSCVLFCRLLISMWDSGSLEIVGGEGGEGSYFIQSVKEEEEVKELEQLDIGIIEDFAMTSIADARSGSCDSDRGSVLGGVSQTFALEDFYLSNSSIDAAADLLQIGSIYYVRPELMVTPSHFYVSLEDKVESRDNFISEMTNQYEEWMKGESWDVFAVSPDLFKSILYVAIKFEDEWARGRIVKKWKDGYKVLLVDMGLYMRNVKIEEMKYLHKDFIDMPELSICCSLQQDVLRTAFPIQNIRQNIFCSETLNAFYSLLTGHLLGIMPFTRNKEMKWEVYMYLVPDEFSKTTILVTDVASYLVQKKKEAQGIAKDKSQCGKDCS